jgi:alpha-N-arabinofuranosidase
MDTVPAGGGGSRRNRNNIPPLTTQPAEPPAQPLHWAVVSEGIGAKMEVDTADPVNTGALSHSLRLDVSKEIHDWSGRQPRAGIANEGYWGMAVVPGTEYRASFYARGSADFKGGLTVDLERNDGTLRMATATVPAISTEWKKYTVTLKAGAAAGPAEAQGSAGNRFVISTTERGGSVWFSLVSVFPPTYHDRPNGNRKDLMELLAGLNPAFLRFPGGNYLQGDYFNERFDWKKTIGPLEDRPGHMGPWRYRSSDGMGLLEYLEWCEDLKMEPVLAVFAGFALKLQHVPAGPELQPYVQDALDEIEYVTGDASTKWGAQRAKDGHPAPFKLRYVEVGNEDAFDIVPGDYDGRFGQFFDAIRAKYPEIKIIATMKVKGRTPDLLDDHYYRTPEVMARDSHHYDADRYPRDGAKVMVGEYASREGGNQRTLTPTLRAALGDAAWLTGLERNSDVVLLSCYAPLLANMNRGGSQWTTDLIGFDASGSFGSPSYYAIQMFAKNRGDVVLPVVLKDGAGVPTTMPRGAGGTSAAEPETVFATASREEGSGEVIVKVVNTEGVAQRTKVVLEGVKEIAGGTVEVLTGDPAALNSVAEPRKVAPVSRELKGAAGNGVEEVFPAYSVSVLRVKVR